MKDQEIKDRKIYYRENKLGKVVDIKRPFSGNTEVAIIEISNNSFKAAPLEFISPVANRLQFSGERSIIDNFPALSSRDIENDPDKLKQAIEEHYGEPQHWQKNKKDFDASKGDGYMGSSQISEQEPSDNRSIKEDMDYEKINRGKRGD